jgi:hypothetical protein
VLWQKGVEDQSPTVDSGSTAIFSTALRSSLAADLTSAGGDQFIGDGLAAMGKFQLRLMLLSALLRKDKFVMNESFMNELKKYENGRVLLDPPVRSILRGVTNYEWVVVSVDNKIVKLQSTPGDYGLGFSPSFIFEIKELPQKSNGIKRATLVLKDYITYSGKRFESTLFPNEVF